MTFVSAGRLAITAAACCACCVDSAAPGEEHNVCLGTFLFSTSGPAGSDHAAFQTALHDRDLYTVPLWYDAHYARMPAYFAMAAELSK
jgi:hypothetical protein